MVSSLTIEGGREGMDEQYPVLHGGCNQKGPYGGWDRISCQWMDKLVPDVTHCSRGSLIYITGGVV